MFHFPIDPMLNVGDIHVFNHKLLSENTYKWTNEIGRHQLEILRNRLIIFERAFVYLRKLPFSSAQRNKKIALARWLRAFFFFFFFFFLLFFFEGCTLFLTLKLLDSR